MIAIQHYIKIHSILKYPGRFKIVKSNEEALNLISLNRLKAEIIGQWIYCFTTALIGVQLQSIGFWYSYKHQAYVFSGGPKDGNPYDETLDEIRARLGSWQVQGGNNV
jgi:hypothetical protein